MLQPPGRIYLTVARAAQALRTTPLAPLVPTKLRTPVTTFDQEAAVEGFRVLGPLASPAIPALETMAQNTNDTPYAIMALANKGTNALPALSRLATNPRTACTAIGTFMFMAQEGAPIDAILAQAAATDILPAALEGVTRLPPAPRNSHPHKRP